MIVAIISWIYMSIICVLVGVGVLSKVKNSTFTLMHYMIAGIVAITVYVQYFSVIGKIGALAHILMLLVALACGALCRKKVFEIFVRVKETAFSWEGFFYICFIIFIAFFTSRGDFHTDTNIYHAQAIRLYEEYGLIKGMANLQLHYGYNSSSLAFASIFSMNWLFGRSIHTTTGFYAIVMSIYSFHRLKAFKEHKGHVTDLIGVGMLFYTLVILERCMSPATDYVTMYFAMYVMMAWCENMEGEKDYKIYCLISVLAVFVLTLKFSACMLALLVIHPAVYLVKSKKWKEIGIYILAGCIIVAPFLIRNFLLSGWLLYPFNGIDIFSVEWKVPEEYLLVDANQIKVWGRCLYDVSKVNWKISQWLPIWWEDQERYAQMLMGSVLMGTLLLLVQFISGRIKKEKMNWEIAVLILVIYANLAVWFVMAPFIRYGLAFIFAVPLVAVGIYLGEKKTGFYSIVSGGLIFCIVVTLSPYWDNYITDAGVFLKQRVTDPYYILQKDYDEGEMEIHEINGHPIYYAPSIELNSYHVWPSTCYWFMLERTTLMGNEIEDGFKAKDMNN